MLQSTSRIESDNGIKFYEKDILFDDYVYNGDIDIETTIKYTNNGFGILFINNENTSLADKDEQLLFKLGNKNINVIYKSKLQQQSTVFNAYCFEAKTITENLKIKISKRNNIYTVYVNDNKILVYTSKFDISKYNIGYYSNKDNIIKTINIAAAVPYGWIVNMKNTNGGYITFSKDSFELTNCKNNAEVEQLNIELNAGKYYLKFNSHNSNIIPYIFYSDDTRIYDNEKNILSLDNSFTIKERTKVSLKFVGTKGKISNIAITSFKENEYIRTDIDSELKQIEGSTIDFDLKNIKSISFNAIVKYTPGIVDYSPVDYYIISDKNKNYGIGDLVIALNTQYNYRYENKQITISNNNNERSIYIDSDILSIFNNVNGIITDLIIIDNDDNVTNVTIQNTLIKSVPGLIKSPIVVLDPYDNPLNISSSFRYIEDIDTYFFTNIEREYFYVEDIIKRNGQIKLEEELRKDGYITMYGVPLGIQYDLTKLLHIETRGKDNIGLCCNNEFHTFYKSNIETIGAIDIKNNSIYIKDIELLNNYELIVVDYLKNNNYAINYNYEYNSYEVDISTDYLDDVNILYDNTEIEVGSYEYINEKLYYDTKITPSENCYIVIGR